MSIYSVTLFMLLQLLLNINVYATCDIANDLVLRANELANQNASPTEQKRLLQEAIDLCPNNAEAHNNLGNLFGYEQQYDQAIQEFKEALKYDPNLRQAWYGLGEAYYDQGQFPLSLKAYLQICQQDQDAHRKATELLNGQRYATVEQGKIFTKDSLLMLYDKQKREHLEKLIAQCGFKAYLDPVMIFQNLIFEPDKAILVSQSQAQLEAIIQTLKEVAPKQISVRSYTGDINLAEIRAITLKTELTKDEIPEECIEANGYTKLSMEQVEIEARGSIEQVEIKAE